ncbi:MAG: reverse transcriptase/maturase family protein [Streptosporangiaceae bacterium]
MRPLGIATLEDKIVQRAVTEVLNAIYETDFRGFSFGFRPGRKPHDALDALTVGIKQEKVNWVLAADIRGLFISLDHRWLERFLGHALGHPRRRRHPPRQRTFPLAPVSSVAESFHRLDARYPGRFVLGIGAGHRENEADYRKPYEALVDNLDELDRRVCRCSAETWPR